MRRACVVALSASLAFTALPAVAGPGLPFLPQTPGQRQAYHIVHIVQTADGAQTATSDVTIVRRAGTALVIERTGTGGVPNLSVLKTANGGTLALSEDAQGAAADGDLADVLFALNLAIVATRDGDPSGGASWDANLLLASTPRATTTQLLMQPGRLAGTEFDFGGIGQSSLPMPPAPCGIAVTLRVDGHFAGGRVQRIAFFQTRVITVAGVPYVNAGSWSITATGASGR